MSADNTLIHSQKYSFLLVSSLSAFMGTLDASIVNVSLPTLSRIFAVSIQDIAWVVLAYTLTISATLLFVGRISAKRGFRYTYKMGFGLFTLGSLLCGLSTDFETLVLSRVLHGIGASFLMASGPALITRAFPANERGKALGIMGTVVGVGLMSGPPIGGLIVSTIGWQWMFLLNIPIGIFGYIHASRLLKLMKPDAPDTRLNYLGGVLQAGAVVFLLLFLNRLNSTDWPQLVLYSILILGLSSLALFIWRELKSEHPLIGLKIFAYREFTIAISAMMISFICTASGMVLIPFYLEELLLFSPTQVGLVIMTIPICMAVVAPVAGRISDKIGYKLLTISGLVMMSAGIFWISTLDQNSTRLDVVIRLIVMGIGGGMFQVPNSSVMMASVPRHFTAVASSLLAVSRTLGLAGGVAVATAAFAYRQTIYSSIMGEADAFAEAFSWVMIGFGIFSLLAIVIAIIRKNKLVNVD
ncbi:MAG: MFS transporter [candidate division Zixibacteria bacterium]|nr:MFS transporter [candidate division Zixibacteria bacterium]